VDAGRWEGLSAQGRVTPWRPRHIPGHQAAHRKLPADSASRAAIHGLSRHRTDCAISVISRPDRLRTRS